MVKYCYNKFKRWLAAIIFYSPTDFSPKIDFWRRSTDVRWVALNKPIQDYLEIPPENLHWHGSYYILCSSLNLLAVLLDPSSHIVWIYFIWGIGFAFTLMTVLDIGLSLIRMKYEHRVKERLDWHAFMPFDKKTAYNDREHGISIARNDNTGWDDTIHDTAKRLAMYGELPQQRDWELLLSLAEVGDALIDDV